MSFKLIAKMCFSLIRYYDLVPLAAEIYNGSDATYYAVAVQRSVSDVTKLSDLRGNYY